MNKICEKQSTFLSDLANLGPKSEAMLRKAGINSVEELRELGSIETFLQVKIAGISSNLNLLYALEGAIRNEHWQDIAKKDKLSLLMQLEDRELEIKNKNFQP